MVADELIKKYLKMLRWQFFPDDAKGFYQQQRILIIALTTPAKWLEERGVRLPASKLDAILNEIVLGVKRFSDPQVGYFCRYFLKCVQSHMKHHGDRYYAEAKALRSVTETAVDVLTRQQAAKLGDAQDRTSSELAALHKLVSATKPPRAKKAAKTETQAELF